MSMYDLLARQCERYLDDEIDAHAFVACVSGLFSNDSAMDWTDDEQYLRHFANVIAGKTEV